MSRARKVSQIDKSTSKVIQTYDTLTAAAVSVGGAITNIHTCCKGRAKSAYGYRWSYLEEVIK